jgi:DNA-binding phage protein
MLRVSATTTRTDIDLAGVNGDPERAARGIRFGAELMRFGEAVARRDERALAAARQTLLDNAGPAVLVDAAGVAANFQRMVRIADAIGIPVDDLDSDLSRQVRDELGLERFRSAGNSQARTNRPGEGG